MKTIILILMAVMLLAGCESCLCPDCICPACEECEQCPQVEACTAEGGTVTVTKYVCPDGIIMDNAQACLMAPAKTITETSQIDVRTIKTEDGTAAWETVLVPACILGKNGGRIHYETVSLPSNVVVEAKEFGGAYSDMFSFKGLYEAEKSFLVCDGGKCYGGDFVLNLGKVYILKVRYEMSDENLYSKEFIVDLRTGSEYITKVCAK